jgi:hypothetical protein
MAYQTARLHLWASLPSLVSRIAATRDVGSPTSLTRWASPAPGPTAGGPATAELDLFGPFAEQVGPAAYQVRSHHGEWEVTLYLAQPVRHTNGIVGRDPGQGPSEPVN